MDKDWPARFEASEKTRSISTHPDLLDMLELLELLGYVGLAIGVVIRAVCYFTKSRPSLL
jgi:hypothetical protein